MNQKLKSKSKYCRPRILANFAVSADGKISTKSRSPSGFTSTRDKRKLLEIRALGDALLVGRITLETDQMSMGLPDASLRKRRLAAGMQEYPLRVILTKTGTIDPDLKVFRSPGGKILVFSGSKMSQAVQKTLGKNPGVDLHVGRESGSLQQVLQILFQKYAVKTLVCEGGGALLRSLAEMGAIDELRLTIAPIVFGGEDAPMLTGTGREYFEKFLKFQMTGMDVQDGECFLEYLRPGAAPMVLPPLKV